MPGSIPILRVGQTLLATIQIELRDSVAEAFQIDLLTEIERTGVSGLVIDITALDMVDSYVARILADTAKMAKVMGTKTVLVGMRPTVAAILTRMGYLMEGVSTALNVEDGLVLLGEHLMRSRRER
jgi:rsbT antagonist protein RsbS